LRANTSSMRIVEYVVYEVSICQDHAKGEQLTYFLWIDLAQLNKLSLAQQQTLGLSSRTARRVLLLLDDHSL